MKKINKIFEGIFINILMEDKCHISIFRIKVVLLLFIASLSIFLIYSEVNSDNYLNLFNKPIAVMIGNSPKERLNQKGINEADVIYEIEVEFPFTRYMAIFLEDTETVVGPVRSSRWELD